MIETTKYEYDISILIPSLGRPTLKKVIDQIIQDKGSFRLQIIVIADGHEAMASIRSISFLSREISLILNTRTKGVSGSLNSGLKHASGEYLMIFSDDDEWLSGKIGTSIESIKGKKNTCICFQVETLGKNGLTKVRPSYRPKSPIEPLLYCYGNSPFLNNPRYLSLTSFIAPIGVKEYFFPEDLASREDIVWLHNVYRNGFDIIFAEGICAKVEIGYDRTSERDSDPELARWLCWLEKNSPHVQANFLFSHFLRPYVVTSNITLGLKVLYKNKIWRFRPSFKSVLVFSFLVTSGFLRQFARLLLRNNLIKPIS